MLVMLMLFALEICTALHTCPNNGGENVELAFGLSNTQAYLQQGFWHRIPCPTFRSGEKTDGVIWYRGSSIDDSSKVRLLSRSSTGDFPASERYAFLSGFSLLIKGVEEADQGSYLCQVIPQETGFRVRRIYLHVIGKMFPASPNDTSSAQSFQRGRRQTLPCPCVSHTPDVVYWSTGEGVTTDTQTIGARFSDGATLQIQHGADYSIGSDGSLTVNSLNDIQDTHRFWCHVFQDGLLQNCFTDGSLSDEQKSTDDPLGACEATFYLQKGQNQTLPCLSWTPGDTACKVEWSKLDNPDRQVLSYNLSTGVVDSSPGFDLASDFGLVIQSVDDDHAGVYRCAIGNDSYKDVEVQVIGNNFLQDEGNATSGGTFTLLPGRNLTLPCPSVSCVSMKTKAHLHWSFDATGARNTTDLIGTLTIPDGPTRMSDLGDNGCFQISLEGSLLLNNCSLDGEVRYWCYIIPAGACLLRSFVDVKPESLEDPGEPCAMGITKVTFGIVVVFSNLVSVLIVIGVCYLRDRRRRESAHGSCAIKQEDDNQL